MPSTRRRGRRAFLGTAAMTLAAAELGGLGLAANAGGSRQLTALGDAHGVAQFAPAVDHEPARQARPRPVRHLYVHQLAPDASVRSRVASAVHAGTDRDRRAHPRVRLREGPRQRASRDAAPEHRLPDRARQRLCHLAGLRQPLLARALPPRRPRTRPLPPLRRGRVRAIGEGHSAAARGHGRTMRHGRRPRRASSVTATGFELPADWRTCDLPRSTSVMTAARASHRPAVRRWQSAAPTRSRHGWISIDGPSTASGRWRASRRSWAAPPAGSSADFTPATSTWSWGHAHREGRVRFRVSVDGQPPGPARGVDVDDRGAGTVVEQRLVSTGPATRAHRRSDVRDRVPRRRSRGVRVHVRLTTFAG